MKTILFVTVGGSHQPIVTAIKESQPDFVVFFCSGTNPATQRPGSELQITGVGHCIKADFKPESKPSLPNIPTQAGLKKEQCEISIVQEDNLQRCCQKMSETIQTIASQYPDAHLVADYTGGTKTMTAALAMVAVNTPEMTLSWLKANGPI